MTPNLLANISWHSLNGSHARYSSGTKVARRYARGFSPIIGFADVERPDFSALAPYCDLGEHFYCGGWSGPAPAGWQIEADSSAWQLIWAGQLPDAQETPGVVRMGAEHLTAMLELVTMTQPGPFAERTIELGEYYGIFEAGRLVAMAGERFEVAQLKEISTVCTHPDFRGRGLARRLVEHLLHRALARGQMPFLHVMRENDAAGRIYERMGFHRVQEFAVRVVSRVT